jgi:hypothetical protein
MSYVYPNTGICEGLDKSPNRISYVDLCTELYTDACTDTGLSSCLDEDFGRSSYEDLYTSACTDSSLSIRLDEDFGSISYVDSCTDLYTDPCTSSGTSLITNYDEYKHMVETITTFSSTFSYINIEIEFPKPMHAIVTKSLHEDIEWRNISTMCEMLNYERNEKMSFTVECESLRDIQMMEFKGFVEVTFDKHKPYIWNKLFHEKECLFENFTKDVKIRFFN